MAFKLSDWVDIKTKEEIEQEHKDYENKMFPLGANHKDVIAQRIADLFTNNKLSKGEIMYNFLVLKQAYMLSNEDQKAKEYEKWYNSVTSKYLTDDEADIQMAETNIARPDISYMEKARTYQRVHNATGHQGRKADGMTNENLTRIFGDSARNINRYLRLNELNKDFQTLVDEGTISFNAAVELSYLSSEAQEIVFKSIDEKLLIYHHDKNRKQKLI